MTTFVLFVSKVQIVPSFAIVHTSYNFCTNPESYVRKFCFYYHAARVRAATSGAMPSECFLVQRSSRSPIIPKNVILPKRDRFPHVYVEKGDLYTCCRRCGSFVFHSALVFFEIVLAHEKLQLWNSSLSAQGYHSSDVSISTQLRSPMDLHFMRERGSSQRNGS